MADPEDPEALPPALPDVLTLDPTMIPSAVLQRLLAEVQTERWERGSGEAPRRCCNCNLHFPA